MRHTTHILRQLEVDIGRGSYVPLHSYCNLFFPKLSISKTGLAGQSSGSKVNACIVSDVKACERQPLILDVYV